MQPAVLQALLRTVLLRAERLALAAADHPTPSAELQRFFTILDRDCTTTRSVAHYAKAVGVSARRLGELVLAHHLADRCGRSVPRDGAGRAAREEVSTAASADVIQRCS